MNEDVERRADNRWGKHDGGLSEFEGEGDADAMTGDNEDGRCDGEKEWQK